MSALIARKKTAKEIPSLYLIYGYREIEEPNRWYVGSCMYIREQARDDQHRRRFGDGKKFRRELKKIAKGRCFDELVQKVVLEVVWGTPQDAIDRENTHMDRLDSIENGFNSQHAGIAGLAEATIGCTPWNKGKKLKKQSAESNRKRSEKLKGRVFSNEHKHKISQSNKGQDQWHLKGKPRSEETKRKISLANKGRKLPSMIGNQNARGKKHKTAINGTIKLI